VEAGGVEPLSHPQNSMTYKPYGKTMAKALCKS
jgi:hypothetical protein